MRRFLQHCVVVRDIHQCLLIGPE